MTKEEALFQYLLRLGDSNLILGQRLSEWCGHGPAIEEDIALTNIALDLLGQATSYLKEAAATEGKGRTEDDLAMLRKEQEYVNFQLVEQPNGHYGNTIARQFLYDVYHYWNTTFLADSNNETIRAIAVKSLKEIKYHIRHSREWMLRLGDGTKESHQKIQEAIDSLWMYTGEMFVADEVDEIMHKEGVAPNLLEVKENWYKTVSEVLSNATLKMPEDGWMTTGSKNGIHTEHLGYILTELQYMQRTYPNMEW